MPIQDDDLHNNEWVGRGGERRCSTLEALLTSAAFFIFPEYEAWLPEMPKLTPGRSPPDAAVEACQLRMNWFESPEARAGAEWRKYSGLLEASG